MKPFLLFIIASFVSILSYAQDPQLFENTWYLYSVQATDLDPVQVVSEIEPRINPFLIINVNLEYSGEGACNTFTGLYEINPPNQLNSIDFSETGEDCGLQILNAFEDNYFWFLSSGFDFFITQDGPGKVLTMTTPIGGLAVFKSYPLSTIDFINNQFKIYPNPVNDFIILYSRAKFQKLSVQIFSSEGKLLENQNLINQTAINISKLSSGIYFLNIEDENGRIEVKKFIKE